MARCDTHPSASPTESSVAIPEDKEEGGSECAVFALAAETKRCERLLTRARSDVFAILHKLSLFSQCDFVGCEKVNIFS